MTAVADTRLTLANLESRYELVSPPAEGWTLKRELDRIATEQLPHLLAEHILPQIDPDYSVYRIRCIDIDLAINRKTLKKGSIPRLWAEQILRHVFHELRYGDGGNVARFATHADFAATFIVELLRGTAWQSWVYEEFSALKHLTTGEVITEMFVSRPEFFSIFANHVNRQHVTGLLLKTLGEQQADRVLRSMHEAYASGSSATALLEIGKRILPALNTLSSVAYSAPKRRLYLIINALQINHINDDQLAVVLELSQHLIDVQETLMNLSVSKRRIVQEWLMKPGPHTDATPVYVPAALRHLFLSYRQHEQGRHYLQWLLETNLEFTPSLHTSMQPQLVDASAGEALSTQASEDVCEFHSAFAGLSLLLMTIKDLKLYTELSMLQLQHCLLAVLDEKQRHLCRVDPILGAVFPVDDAQAAQSPWPPPSTSLVSGLNEQQRKEIEEAEGAEAWAILLVIRFAKRLPGLEASSPSYLAQQFFCRSGRFCITENTIGVTLETTPLVVVLKMAGLSGWQGRLPWLGERTLTINVSSG